LAGYAEYSDLGVIATEPQRAEDRWAGHPCWRSREYFCSAQYYGQEVVYSYQRSRVEGV